MGATTAPHERGIKKLLHLPTRHLARRLYSKVQDDDITGLGAEIAFNLVFAIPAFLLFLVTLAAVVNQFTGVPIADNLIALINQRAPVETRPLLNGLVQGVLQQVSGLAVSIGAFVTIILALWGGAGGMDVIIKAFNRAYDVKETRSFVRQKLTSIGLTVLSAVLVIAAFVLFVFGGNIGAWVAALFGLGSVFTLVWNLLRWPLAVIFIAFMLAVVYYLGPNIKQSFRWISPGSAVATILWIASVLLFKFYLVVSNPGSAYGAAGSVLVLLYFLYISGMIVVFGAELNAILEKRVDQKTISDLAHHPGKVTSPEEYAKAKQRLNHRTHGEEATVAHTNKITEQVGSATTGSEHAPRPPQEHSWKDRILSLVGATIILTALGWVSNRRDRDRGKRGGPPGTTGEAGPSPG